MKRAWKLVHPIKFRDLWGLVSLVEFSNSRDKEKIVQESPCSFDKHLMVFKEVEETLQVKQLQFTMTQLWLCLHVLIFARNATMGHFICSKRGEVVEVDLDETESTWGRYMQV